MFGKNFTPLMFVESDDPNGGGGGGGLTINEHGYPVDTPVKEMSAEHQAAYWKYHSRKNESLLKSSVSKQDFDKVKLELDEERKNGLTDPEKALEEAKAQGKADAAREYVPRLVKESIRSAVSGRIDEETLESHLEFANMSNFINDSGDVDADKVKRYAEQISPQKEETQTSGPKNRKAWSTGPGGDRDTPPSGGSHSVRSAQEEHRQKLRGK